MYKKYEKTIDDKNNDIRILNFKVKSLEEQLRKIKEKNDIKSEELDRIFVKGKKELVTIYKPVANLMEGYDFTSKKKVKTNSKKDNKK